MNKLRTTRADIRFIIVFLSFLLLTIVGSMYYFLSTASRTRAPQSLTVSFQNTPYVIGVGETLALNADYSVKLVDSQPAPESCRDCFSKAVITVIYSGTEHALTFREGGIAGEIPSWKFAGPVAIQILEIRNGAVTFEYRLEPEGGTGGI